VATTLVFQIHHRGQSGFQPAAADPEGFQESAVLGRRFRLQRRRDAHGMPAFDLLVKE